MNILAKYEEDNPGHGFEDTENHGDLWDAINKCREVASRADTRIAVVDERLRMALWIILPLIGFLVAIQLTCLVELIRP